MKKLLAVIALTIRHRCPSSCPGGGGLHRHLRRISMQPVESNAGPLVRLSPSRRRVPVGQCAGANSSSFLAVRPLGVLVSGSENLSPRRAKQPPHRESSIAKAINDFCNKIDTKW